MENKKLKDRFEDIVNEYIDIFCAKHDIKDPEYWWVGGCVGEVLFFNDDYFNFLDIKYDVDNMVPGDSIFEWYDYSVELATFDAVNVSFENWLKGVRPYTDEQLVELRNAFQNVEEAKNRLFELIEQAKTRKN